MASCGCAPSAYGEGLRCRVVWQKQGLGYSNEIIATNLNIYKSTVCSLLLLICCYKIMLLLMMRMFANTGTMAELPYPKDRAARDPAKLFIVHLVVERLGLLYVKCKRSCCTHC